MRIKTNVKAGKQGGDCDEFGCGTNHNQTVAKGLRVKSKIKAGKIVLNHNQTLAR
jgi:hypothetical protein